MHEQYLRIVYSDIKSYFKECFDRDSPVFIHHQNVKFPVIEMHRVFKVQAHKLQNTFFSSEKFLTIKKTFRFPNLFCTLCFQCHRYTKCLGPKTWEVLPNGMKQLESFKGLNKSTETNLIFMQIM